VRKYFGWISIALPPATAFVAGEISWRFLTHGSPRRTLIFDALVLAWVAGVVLLILTPFRSPAVKWTCAVVYVLLMPVVMLAIDVAIEGVEFGSGSGSV